MENIRIGLFGVDFLSGNLGCQALTYSLTTYLSDALRRIGRRAYVTLYIQNPSEIMEPYGVSYNNIQTSVCYFEFSKPEKVRKAMQNIKKEDIVFDISGGDSFTDLYGWKRFFTWSFLRSYAEKRVSYFVLAPQTYGPYKNYFLRCWAQKIIKSADCVLARDEMSYDFIRKVNTKSARLVTDVAFALPYRKDQYSFFPADKKRAGLNVSGLLYHGGYTGKNQFNLKMDYVSFIHQLIEILLAKGYSVYLIPHVITADENNVENDAKVCKRLAEKYPLCKVSPTFSSPIDAKSYISNMDLFIGSRMHATIASFSTGVPTIPVSYSKKFIGLFGGLGYQWTIDSTKLDTNGAVNLMEEYLNHVSSIKSDVERLSAELQRRGDGIIDCFSEIIGGLSDSPTKG